MSENGCPTGTTLYHCKVEDEELWGGSVLRDDSTWADYDVFDSPEKTLQARKK